MNALPVDFYKNVFRYFEDDWFSASRALSEPFGALARDHYENHTVYVIIIKNGQISKALLWCYHTDVRMEKSDSTIRNLGLSQIVIQDNSESDEDSTDPCKLPNTRIELYLESATISKASEKLIDSIRILGYLDITVPITSQIHGILERIVQKKTLGSIYFKNVHQFDESSTKLLLDLLKQEMVNVRGDLNASPRFNSHRSRERGLFDQYSPIHGPSSVPKRA